MLKSAFTMIELIFVIVILGILAAVAIPKLAATRDDAKVVIALENAALALSDISNAYTATGNLLLASTDAPIVGECFTFSLDDNNSDGTDDSIIVAGSSGDNSYCPDVIERAISVKIIGTHVFAGNSVVY